MKLGKFQIDVIVENRSMVDGGMMFGVVPKKIWEKSLEVTAENQIAMDLNLFVIRTEDKTILVDTGLGEMLTEKQRKIYGVVNSPSKLLEGLDRLGLTPEDFDYVILTHLHLDHAGGCVRPDDKGEPISRFPNAEYIVQKLEWEAANNPDDRSQAAYDKSKYIPVHNNGQLRIIDGSSMLIDGIELVLTGGHTLGHQGVIIYSDNEKLFLFADIVPFSMHLRPAYVASADLFPLETIKIKKDLMPRLAQRGWYLGFDHDIDIKVCKIVDTGLKLAAEKIEV